MKILTHDFHLFNDISALDITDEVSYFDVKNPNYNEQFWSEHDLIFIHAADFAHNNLSIFSQLCSNGKRNLILWMQDGAQNIPFSDENTSNLLACFSHSPIFKSEVREIYRSAGCHFICLPNACSGSLYWKPFVERERKLAFCGQIPESREKFLKAVQENSEPIHIGAARLVLPSTQIMLAVGTSDSDTNHYGCPYRILEAGKYGCALFAKYDPYILDIYSPDSFVFFEDAKEAASKINKYKDDIDYLEFLGRSAQEQVIARHMANQRFADFVEIGKTLLLGHEYNSRNKFYQA